MHDFPSELSQIPTQLIIYLLCVQLVKSPRCVCVPLVNQGLPLGQFHSIQREAGSLPSLRYSKGLPLTEIRLQTKEFEDPYAALQLRPSELGQGSKLSNVEEVTHFEIFNVRERNDF